MNNTILPIGILACIFAIIFVAYKIKHVKRYKLEGEKIKPKVSIVILVKNNQKLLEHVIKILSSQPKNIDEIIILDMGSIDNSLKVAKEAEKLDSRVKFYSIDNSIIEENYLKTIQNYVNGEIHFILDLYKIELRNPNVYVPDLFKHLDTTLTSEISSVDDRIDGTKLLDFDTLEREKNSYVIKENIVEVLSNIRMMLETYSKKASENSEEVRKQIEELLKYMDNSIKNLVLLTSLMGTVEFSKEELNNNILAIFKDYSQSHKVTIDYKVSGTERHFKDSINQLILRIIEELLYIVVQHNLITDIFVLANYKHKLFEIEFKFTENKNRASILSVDNKLSYYVLQSIQNNLKLINGKINIKTKPNGVVKLIVQVPIDEITCSTEGVNQHEEVKNS